MNCKWFSTTTLLALLITVGLSSCKTANSGNGNGNQPESRLLDYPTELGGSISGVWSLNCVSGYASPGYYRHTYTFGDNGELSYENKVYGDSACSDLASVSNCSGRYTANEMTGNLDISCEQIEIELLNQNLVDAYNQKNICGKSWAKDQSIALTSSSCTQNEASEQFANVFNNYQIYNVQGSALYFGFPDAIYTGMSSDKRPKRLMFGLPYSR